MVIKVIGVGYGCWGGIEGWFISANFALMVLVGEWGVR